MHFKQILFGIFWVFCFAEQFVQGASNDRIAAWRDTQQKEIKALLQVAHGYQEEADLYRSQGKGRALTLALGLRAVCFKSVATIQNRLAVVDKKIVDAALVLQGIKTSEDIQKLLLSEEIKEREKSAECFESGETNA